MMKETLMHVPYGKSVHGEEEIAAVVEVLKTSTQMGKYVKEMEEKTASLFNKKFGIMLNSGSSANYLAIEVLQLPRASEVITPILTFSTTIAPLVKNNLVPVFIDIEPDTFNIDAEQIESVITSKTKAILIPNLLGNLPNWKKIREVAARYGLVVIEDSCDTLGASIANIPSGYYSDISTTSFYGSHIINCAGNGGMLCVNSQKFSNHAKLLRSWGRSSSLFSESESITKRFNTKVGGIDYDAKFIFETLAYNLEPSELGAAFGLIQLKKLPQYIKQRQTNFLSHMNFFLHYKKWFVLPRQLPTSTTAWLAFPLIVKESAPFTRKQLQVFFEKKNIQTRTIFTGNILRQPGFNKIKRRESPRGYPNADQVMRGGILIGCHQGLTQEMLYYIYTVFEAFIKTQINNSILA
jgi:CDP-4-dehydro-6-deoxyglucose reductase, E1